MNELLAGARGERLAYDDYVASVERDYQHVGRQGFWKLERRQSFQEPTSPSWRAFDRGDWPEAVRLAQEQRPALEAEYRQDAEMGVRSWWVKVVEFPITPYLRWAFEPLRVRAQSGERMRVVRADQVEEYEHHGQLPEMITLGADVMYDINYDQDGLQEGGTRIDDHEVVARCRRLIAELYDKGEDFETFYQREIAPLAPPVR
jgi:hypothetical protein